ncbi:MAG: DUF4333 domain-containing protein [Solirubrobacterales bacterium]
MASVTLKTLRIPLIIACFLPAVAFVGCGGTVIDTNKAQAAILAEVEIKTGTKIDSVVCPFDVEVIPGAEFTCAVTAADGTEAVAELQIRNEDADVDFIRLTKP